MVWVRVWAERRCPGASMHLPEVAHTVSEALADDDEVELRREIAASEEGDEPNRGSAPPAESDAARRRERLANPESDEGDDAASQRARRRVWGGSRGEERTANAGGA